MIYALAAVSAWLAAVAGHAALISVLLGRLLTAEELLVPVVHSAILSVLCLPLYVVAFRWTRKHSASTPSTRRRWNRLSIVVAAVPTCLRFADWAWVVSLAGFVQRLVSLDAMVWFVTFVIFGWCFGEILFRTGMNDV